MRSDAILPREGSEVIREAGNGEFTTDSIVTEDELWFIMDLRVTGGRSCQKAVSLNRLRHRALNRPTKDFVCFKEDEPCLSSWSTILRMISCSL